MPPQQLAEGGQGGRDARAVPGEGAAVDQLHPGAGEGGGHLVGVALGELVRLGGEQHQLGGEGGHRLGVELGVAGARVVQHRLAPGQPEQVGGIGPAAQPQPRVAPDRAGVADPAGGPAPVGVADGGDQVGVDRRRPGQVADGGGQVAELGHGPGDGGRHGHEHGQAAGLQALDVQLAVLLGVGHDQVGRQPADGGQVGVLGAPDPGQPVERAGRLHAPVGDPDQPLPHPGEHQPLGQRRDQADHPPHPVGQRDGGPAGVDDVPHASRSGGCGSRPPRSGPARTPGRPGG